MTEINRNKKMNKLIISKKIKAVIKKSLTTNKSPGTNGFTGEFY